MKLVFGSSLQKIIAAILSIFVTVSIAAPAVKPLPKNHIKNETAAVQVAQEAKEEIELVEDEAPAAEPKAEAEAEPKAEAEAPAAEAAAPDAPAAEAAAPAENEIVAGAIAGEARAAEEAEEIETAEQNDATEWDISEDLDGTVKMYYVPEEKGVLENVTAAVKAFILPMTVYAAEVDEDINEDDHDAIPTEHVGGTIVIEGNEEGTGRTQRLAFLHLLDLDTLLPAYEEFCEEIGLDENDFYIDYKYVDKEGNFESDGISAAEAHAIWEDNEHLIYHFYPTAIIEMMRSDELFWDHYGLFTPTRIEINGNIDTISFGTFAMMTNVEEVVFDGTVKRIECGAFLGDKFAEITLPEGLEKIGVFAFNECSNLAKIELPSTLTYIDAEAFTEIAPGARIYCKTAQTFDLLANHFTKCDPMSKGRYAYSTLHNFDAGARIYLNGNLVYGAE